LPLSSMRFRSRVTSFCMYVRIIDCFSDWQLLRGHFSALCLTSSSLLTGMPFPTQKSFRFRECWEQMKIWGCYNGRIRGDGWWCWRLMINGSWWLMRSKRCLETRVRDRFDCLSTVNYSRMNVWYNKFCVEWGKRICFCDVVHSSIYYVI
jgi:hypothetical protein